MSKRWKCTSPVSTSILEPTRAALAITIAIWGVGVSCTHGPALPSPKGSGDARAKMTPIGTVDNPLGIHLELHKKTLSNGLRIILVEDPSTPVITYQTWYRVGSVDERPGLTGLSHLFEHLMFKGTDRYPSKAFFTNLEANGAEVNAYTTRDFTAYHETFTPSLLDRAIDMEADRMSRLVLDERTVATEKQVVLEERRLRTDSSPEGKMQEALWALAYQVHPYHWPVIGYPPDVIQAPLQAVTQYYRDHYNPSNAVIVAVGRLNVDQTFEKIKRAYGDIPSGSKPSRSAIPDEPEQHEERRFVIRDQVSSERLAEAYAITAAKDRDSYALDVAANILFEGSSSRAYRRLVEEKNIALSVGGVAFTPTYPGLFQIDVEMKSGISASVAEDELEKIVRELQCQPPSEREVRAAVRQLTVQLIDGARTPGGLAQMIGTVTMILGDPDLFASDVAQYLKVTPDDVMRVARFYLIPNHRSVVTLKPASGEKLQ